MFNQKSNEFIAQNCEDAIKDIDCINKLSNKVIFITGCGGFVGRWLLEFILKLNTAHSFNVKVYATTRLWELDNPELAHLVNHKNFHFSEIDVRNEFSIPEDVNKVIHLAGSPDRKEIASDPIKLIDTVVKGTSNLLDAVNEQGKIDKTLNFTSGYVNPACTVNAEGQTTLTINDPSDLMAVYSESKRMSEVLSNVYRRRFQLSITNVRPFAFFGPFMDLNKVWAINNFFLDAINGNSIAVNGDKRTVRSYMYPADMAFQVMRLLVVDKDIISFDLGSKEEVTLGQLAKNIGNLFGLKQKYSANADIVQSDNISVFVPQNGDHSCTISQGDICTLNQSLENTKIWLELKD